MGTLLLGAEANSCAETDVGRLARLLLCLSDRVVDSLEVTTPLLESVLHRSVNRGLTSRRCQREESASHTR